MILYHGSNITIETIDFNKCKPGKDFGKGFYLTDIKQQAEEMARRSVRYDIVVGPVADDGIVYQLERYRRKMITLDTLVNELTYQKVNNQYFFGTDKAVNNLIKL